MTHLSTIKQIQSTLTTVVGVDAAILYGSYARQEATVNSDLDIQLIINDGFQKELFVQKLESIFVDNDLLKILNITSRNKIVVYFRSKSKVEIALNYNVEEIKRNYIGSEIRDYLQTILFERNASHTKLQEKLPAFLNGKKEIRDYQNADILIDKFVYEFESCSTMHRRSDGYQFYFYYNIALHVAFQLYNISKGNLKYNFLPKYMLASSFQTSEREDAYQLNGTMFLPDANVKKRKLLDFFFQAIQNLTPSDRVVEIKSICEYIYERDFFWNFRDIATYNSRIKPNQIYRTATLSVFQNEPQFAELLDKAQINSIVDLRADREIEEKPYHPSLIAGINYVKCQLDPWNQPEWFKQKYHYGTNEEIAYRFFALGCREEIKRTFESIINNQEGATAIHCFAGKDRTGIVVSMIHLLSGAPMGIIETDYLASEVDVKLYRLKLVLDIIETDGGIEPYLLNCGLTTHQLFLIKEKLFIHANN
ncbi:MAG: tyrosine-protein phosphatase [Bacteroidales bacterium]